MLRLEHIYKVYKAGSNKVYALRDISVSFRKNEFVSILGPSGSGKTTLLNIIGGLDKYDHGDLVIVGKSTKDFKDRDWDYYRNQRIGFIFQSYNLIPHQNILRNVELALTISGVNKVERRERALKALASVGLAGQENKKPNQLSGGQCQRVAIARALVNNPEILLADEPTGALDTKTSVQIMNLIKEISKDRLVIMVTHNPDLAKQYSSRILKLIDGKIVSDSRPFATIYEKGEIIRLPKSSIEKKTKAKMSWGTSIGLSTKNLLSKFKRTLLVSIAGSIGIIGVSSVLAFSNGISNYIESMQDDMLSAYPLVITEQAVDYSALMGGLASASDAKAIQIEDGKINVNSMIEYLVDKYSDFTSVKTNDINHDLMSFIEEMPNDYYALIKNNYDIDPTNNIFTTFEEHDGSSHLISLNGLTQRYISSLKTVRDFKDYAQFVDLFTNFMNLLPDSKDYIVGTEENEGQYDLLCGEFATEENEIMLVVDNNQSLTDLTFAQLGYFSEEEFFNVALRAFKESQGYSQEELDKYSYRRQLSFDEILSNDKKFYYYPHDSIYSYQNVFNQSYSTISILVARMISLTEGELMYLAYNPTTDSLAGMRLCLGMSSLIEQLSFSRDSSSPVIKGNESIGKWNGKYNGNLSTFEIVDNQTIIINGTTVRSGKGISFVNVQTNENLYSGNGFAYNAEILDKPTPERVELKITGILRPNENTKFGCLERGVYYTDKFAKKYMKDAQSSQILTDPEHGFYSYIANSTNDSLPFLAYTKFTYSDYTDEDNPIFDTVGYASCLNANFSNNLSSLFSGITGGIDYKEIDKFYLRSLSGLAMKQIPEYSDDFLHCITCDKDESYISYYAIDDVPSMIQIYPTSFVSKDQVTNYLNIWNSKDSIDITTNKGVKTLSYEERDELTYQDTIEIIIAVINELIKIITIALVAFTSLSLVVSCFMIAVITYISVVERVKEIGVIRSLGGRKKDVRHLFTAETFVIGIISGGIGVGFTYLLCLIVNIVLLANSYPAIALLNPIHGLIMIGLSFLLTVISGIIPSGNASKQSPVDALRSE